jgi:hypothetical protein
MSRSNTQTCKNMAPINDFVSPNSLVKQMDGLQFHESRSTGLAHRDINIMIAQTFLLLCNSDILVALEMPVNWN